MVSRIKLDNLFRIAIGGGIVVVITGYYLEKKIINRIKETEYYVSGVQALKSHQGACQLLGEPFRVVDWSPKDKSNNCDGDTASLQFPVNGSKKKATYYFWANRIDERWIITKAELQFIDDPNRRLVVVKSNPTDETIKL
ncbi:uncharacterized protein LOC143917480 [Arctopsyche grandis]|uniref:uncharacterized protein LOC143917480 n=1 Tax=Arctopsyche grandis TaxID=121162 RepID=UPI00406D6A11